MARLFDVYIAVDWSAKNGSAREKPAPDSVWVGERVAADVTDEPSPHETFWRTRFSCRQHLLERLHHHTESGRRVLIGFDFPYGYPSGFATSLRLPDDSPPWRKVWDELGRLIKDTPQNINNRFEVAAELNKRCGGPTPGPMWGCPASRSSPTLEMTSPTVGYPYPAGNEIMIERLRWVERRVRGVAPTWKLFGLGSVGSQSLVGIPVVRYLRDDPSLRSFSQVWPFETGFAPEPFPQTGPFVLHVEIWPGVVPDPLDPDVLIRDQAQVRATVQWFSRLDDEGRLGDLFDTPVDLPADAIQACVEDEGWILGGG